MSDLSLASGHPAPTAQRRSHLHLLIPLLLLTASVVLALPAINGGVFDALSTDDAMRLVEVRDLITEELARRGSREALVPIDRDPVPTRFSELVRRYYEELGKDRPSTPAK